MNAQEIVRLLNNAGFHVMGTDMSFIYIEDPACIIRSFATFAEYAWIVITFIAGILITGWGISMIRGIKNDIFTNMRNLILIFCGLGLTGPIVNFIWGDDLFARGCKTLKVSIPEIQKTLDARDSKFRVCDNCDLYENFGIEDSGPGMVTDISQTDITELQPIEIDNNPIDTSNRENEPTPQPSDNTTPGEQINKIDESNNADKSHRAISATSEGKSNVIYTYSDNSRIRYKNGTRAWRNTNPGNIRYSNFAKSMGAIGTAGRFSVFPSEQVGANALAALLLTDKYKNLSIKDAISRYAPPSENDTNRYQNSIQKATGLDINRRIADLSAEELNRVVTAIRQHEGWKTGVKEKL